MNIIKRDGRIVEFSKPKITKAIEKAMAYTTKGVDKELAKRIANKVASENKDMTVEEIQDHVENYLMASSRKDVAREYVCYRRDRQNIREKEKTNNSILEIIDIKNKYINEENSNKNSVILSTQRDYMAGEVSKDLTNRLLLPKDIAEAHKQGVIHFHDADYFAQHMFNCFSGNTEFVTDRGIRKFNSCHDGEKVNVLTKEGKWAEATVREYGKKSMQVVTLTSGRTEKKIKCTNNHRWILKNGKVTTNLKVGDRLYLLPEIENTPIKDKHAFCLGFVIGDGSDIVTNNKLSGVRVRLCGDKTKYVSIFEDCGFARGAYQFDNGDIILTKTTKELKNNFLASHAWRYMSYESQRSLFLGLYEADGHKHANGICTANDDVAEMIREISCVAGYHIANEKEIIHDTNFKKDARLISFSFMRKQPTNRNWIVKSIEMDRHGDVYNSWCVEEPSTHTFTLAGGVVTGNCCLINLEDMLQNGTVISGNMIEKPHSFSTACNIATQIMSQVASNEYGGQSETLSHLAPFVDISRQNYRKEVEDEFNSLLDSGEINEVPSEKVINNIAEKRLKKEIRAGVQTIQYQISTLMTTNGQAPFVTIFMYLNEVPEGHTRDDLAMIIEEVVRQRHQGVKNEKGVWITPSFPKLVYVLEEDNIHKDSKYYYLTELCAKCTAKRLVPDYISEKKMLEMKVDKDGNGHCYPPMGL